MPTTPNKNLSVQASGSNAGVWGAGASTALNEGVFQPLDLMLGGVLTVTLGTLPVTLSATEIQYGCVRLTGTLGANVTVTSANIGFYVVEVAATVGAFGITWTNGVAGVALSPATRYWMFADTTYGVRVVAQNPSGLSAPGGYLTLQTGTPVITGDVTNATTIYYTPYIGAQFPVYDGAAYNLISFTERTLALSGSHAASTLYDVFGFSNSGVATIATGPAWASSSPGSCTRGSGGGSTALTRLGGFLVNSVSMTARNGATTYTIAANQGTYLGSIFIDGSAGQVSCYRSWGQARKWGVWNYYNRVPIYLKAGDATANWSFNGAFTQFSNSNSNNNLTVFCGVAEEVVDIRFSQLITQQNPAINDAAIAIGMNSTAASGFNGELQDTVGANTIAATVQASYLSPPILGISTAYALQFSYSSGAVAAYFSGTEAHMVLSANWRG